MTPGTLDERMVPGYDWVRKYRWIAGGSQVVVTDAAMHVTDKATGNPVADWTVASGHVAISAEGEVTVTVLAAEAVTLAARGLKLRYLLDLNDGTGAQPYVEGNLATQ